MSTTWGPPSPDDRSRIGYLVQHTNGRCAEFNAATRQWVPMLSPSAKYATVVTREQAEDVALFLTRAGYPATAVEDAYFHRPPESLVTATWELVNETEEPEVVSEFDQVRR